MMENGMTQSTVSMILSSLRPYFGACFMQK